MLTKLASRFNTVPSVVLSLKIPGLDTVRSKVFEKRMSITCFYCHLQGRVAAKCPNVSNLDENVELLMSYVFDAAFTGNQCKFLRDSADTMDGVHASFLYFCSYTVVLIHTHSSLNPFFAVRRLEGLEFSYHILYDNVQHRVARHRQIYLMKGCCLQLNVNPCRKLKLLLKL